jgi:hypothetical protein
MFNQNIISNKFDLNWSTTFFILSWNPELQLQNLTAPYPKCASRNPDFKIYNLPAHDPKYASKNSK